MEDRFRQSAGLLLACLIMLVVCGLLLFA